MKDQKLLKKIILVININNKPCNEKGDFFSNVVQTNKIGLNPLSYAGTIHHILNDIVMNTVINVNKIKQIESQL